MLRGLFARRAGIAETDRSETERVKALTRALLGDGTDVTVSEIVCLDPACPGTETVMLIMAAGQKTRAAKVQKPAAEVTEPDVRGALLEAGFEVPS